MSPNLVMSNMVPMVFNAPNTVSVWRGKASPTPQCSFQTLLHMYTSVRRHLPCPYIWIARKCTLTLIQRSSETIAKSVSLYLALLQHQVGVVLMCTCVCTTRRTMILGCQLFVHPVAYWGSCGLTKGGVIIFDGLWWSLVQDKLTDPAMLFYHPWMHTIVQDSNLFAFRFF